MTALSVPVDFVESVGWLLIHSLWQFAVIALLIAILLWAMRTMSATVRYWACLLALGTMAAAPAVTFLFLPPNVPAVKPVEANRFLPRRIPHETMAPAPPIVILPGPSGRALPRVETKPTGISAPPQSEMKSAASWQKFLKSAIAPWLEEFVACWCLGVLMFALRPAIGWCMLYRLRHVGTSPIPAAVATVLDRAVERLGVWPTVRAVQSTLVCVPMVAGYLRPIILLPASAMTGLTASQLEAVLLHELAHVRRHDYLVNLLQTLIETLFFYHPAVWWLSSRIRRERELCCDELAAGVLGNRADYGQALLALEELRGSAPLLSLGAKGGSLLERIRRLANVETPRANRGGLVCVVFAAAVLIGVGVWSVGYAGGNAQAAGKNDSEPDQPSKQIDEWGPASDGLRCRLIAVSPTSDAESPETAVPVDNFDQSDDVTFTVELKNVSGKPITLLGVRYGESFTTAAGKLAPAVYAPHLFDFEFTDGNGRPISRPQRVFIDDALQAGSASAHEIAPGKSLTVLLRPGHFNAPMDYTLKGGKYRARVRYRGPSEKAVALVKKHWPEKPHANAWTGEAASNQVAFSVANDPARPTADELQWGEPVNGLRAAVEFQNPQDHPPRKHPPNNVPLNSKLDVIFHIRNVGDKVIHLASETWRQGDELIIKNMAGDVQTVRGIHYLGLPVMVRWTLRPGETAEIYAADLGIAADEDAMESLPDRVGNRWITEPGIYSLRCTIRSNAIQRQDDEGNVILPAENDWVGELVTGETLLNVLEPDRESKTRPEDDADKPNDAAEGTSNESSSNAAQTDPADTRTRELAVRAHAQTMEIDKLPKFLVRSHSRVGSFQTTENLRGALNERVDEDDWFRYESTFAWDEQHFVKGSHSPRMDRPDQPDAENSEEITAHRQVMWGTRELSGEMRQSGEKPRFHVLRENAAAMWKDVILDKPHYLIMKVHQFWWGDNSGHNQKLTSTNIPPSESNYHLLQAEEFDGEMCHVVESPTRLERLWISQKTGHIRGYLLYVPNGRIGDFHKSEALEKIVGRSFATRQEYVDWHNAHYDQLPAEKKNQFHKAWVGTLDFDKARPLVMLRFRDYREIAPGIWWPFREDRTQGTPSEKGWECLRSTHIYEEVRTDVDLTEMVNELQPQEGEKVQDQRYAVPVTYKYRADRTEEEILKIVDEEYQERLEGQKTFDRLTKPYGDMVGKPAPDLPSEGWIGGTRPDVTGQPYLIHLWATWCGPCKNDFPILNELAKDDALVVGLHPAGTPAEDVKKLIQENELGYPTFLSDDQEFAKISGRTIAGYPADVFPYAVLIDADGNVAAHGTLRGSDGEILRKFRELRKATTKRGPQSAGEATPPG